MPKISTDKAAIEHFLTHAVENVYPSRKALEKKLFEGKSLRVYFGIDPTGPSLHLGHVIPMRKLAELQKMGHEIILLIGDFTAMIGDPTDKTATRKQLTREEVLANCKEYKKQAKKILDFGGSNPVKVKFNSTWLAPMSFAELIQLASNFTVQQLMNRDMFRKREHWQVKCQHCHKLFFSPIQFGTVEAFESATLKGNTAICPICHEETSLEKEDFLAPVLSPIYEHEFLYPIMQGYDSVAMDVDMEIGGNDQTFNMLAGRTLMQKGIAGHERKEKFVLTTKLLVDSTGKKMGKTEDNMITLTDSPEEMFGKVMSWPDEMIRVGWELCTSIPLEHVELQLQKHPMTSKRLLAHQIVTELHSLSAANDADDYFTRIHQMQLTPEEAPELKIKGPLLLVDAMVSSTLVSSKTEARRQIEQGGVKVNENIVKDIKIEVKPGDLIQKGKRHFVRLVK